MSRKVAIVTGSSRGIGRGIVLALAERGWDVVINYRGNRQAAEETQQAVKDQQIRSLIIQGNVAHAEDREKLVQGVIEEFGRIDLLVNNAGMGPRQRVDMLQVGEMSYDEVMTTNLKGPFFLTQRVATEMIRLIKEDKISSPKVVNIGSISAYTSSPARAEYCISKAGMGMMTLLWADRLAEYGINVYEIRPGIIETDLTSVVKEKYDKLILEDGITPIRRWGQPEDIGKAVIAIAEELMPFSTGEILNVDGGFHISRL
jgi:NAD(P)-dependent dehydrogenase (short-subunit alcohol dehydrogenase family)